MATGRTTKPNPRNEKPRFLKANALKLASTKEPKTIIKAEMERRIFALMINQPTSNADARPHSRKLAQQTNLDAAC